MNVNLNELLSENKKENERKLYNSLSFDEKKYYDNIRKTITDLQSKDINIAVLESKYKITKNDLKYISNSKVRVNLTKELDEVRNKQLDRLQNEDVYKLRV